MPTTGETTQTGEMLDWIMRTGGGKQVVTLKSGKPVTAQFELNMSGGSPAIFRKDFFARLGCVVDVAKPPSQP